MTNDDAQVITTILHYFHLYSHAMIFLTRIGGARRGIIDYRLAHRCLVSCLRRRRERHAFIAPMMPPHDFGTGGDIIIRAGRKSCGFAVSIYDVKMAFDTYAPKVSLPPFARFLPFTRYFQNRRSYDTADDSFL